MAGFRRVRKDSDATAVQIAESVNGRRRIVRHIGPTAGHSVADDAFAATASTPTLTRIDRFHDAAGEHRPPRLEALSGHDEAELIEAAEGGQIGDVESLHQGTPRRQRRACRVFQISV